MPVIFPITALLLGLGILLVGNGLLAILLGLRAAEVFGTVNGILWGLGPAFWRGLGLSDAEAAHYMALVIAGGVFLQWPIGHLSDGGDQRRVITVVCLAAAAAALLLPVTAGISRPLLALCGFGYGGPPRLCRGYRHPLAAPGPAAVAAAAWHRARRGRG